MNQQKALQLLNTIMPEVRSTGDPDSVMLKCAKENNLAPAQLEKLAQVFNTMKTNFYMDHQANRGDSFQLVNVPELMSKYATFVPENGKEAKDKKPEPWAASTVKYANEEGSRLPSLEELWRASGGAVQDDTDTWNLVDAAEPEYDVQFKAAAAEPKEPTKNELERALEKASQVRFETSVELREHLENLKQKFTPDEGRWAEAVEDTIRGLGKEAAVAVELVEDYFDQEHHKFRGANMAKRAGKNVLVYDRHNVWKDMKEICELIDMQKEAKALVADLTAQLEKKADLVLPPPPQGSNNAPTPQLPRAPHNSNVAPAERPVREREKPQVGMLDYMVQQYKDPTYRELAELIVAPSVVSPREKKWKDDVLRQTQSDTNLHRLLASDSVLREADLNKVKDLYNTLARVSPTLASDPLLMGPTLKEALQYDSIPVQMLKDLVSIEKDQADRAKKNSDLDIVNYVRDVF